VTTAFAMASLPRDARRVLAEMPTLFTTRV
jgi:hypothetical protein